MASSDSTTFVIPTEVWLDVPDYKGLYKVSNMGRVMAVRGERILKLVVSKKGYERIKLWRNGKGRRFFVHRLVMEAFEGHCPLDCGVNHRNGIKTDNRFKNLEYMTSIENIHHAIEVLGVGVVAERKRAKQSIE